jgi:hypothetical protein
MGAPRELASWIERTDARQWGNEGKKARRASEAKNKAQKENRSTARHSGRRLNQPADIEDALEWRLAGLSIAELEALTDALRPFADDFREDRPEVAALLADLHLPGDRRSEWSLACAVLAWDGLRRNDALAFGIAIAEVMAAMKQGMRGSHTNRKTHVADALDDLIDEHLGNQPGMTANSLFDYFSTMAGALHEVLVEFDADNDELVCLLDPAKEALTNIARDDFERRCRRMR